jgi:hypothetical protein
MKCAYTHLSPRTGAKWVLVWRKPDVSIDHVVFKRVKKHINSQFMYKLNKVCTWSSRIGHFESSHVRCSQKHKHTHTLLLFSWEWVLNIIHNRIRRSKFNQAHKEWLTHTRLLSFILSIYYHYYYYSSIFNLYKFRHEIKGRMRDIIMCIVFLSLVFRRRHGLTSGNDEYGWEISRYAHHHRIERRRRAAIIYTFIHTCIHIQKVPMTRLYIYIYMKVQSSHQNASSNEPNI